MKEGWICPRCGKVNAPFIASYDCKPNDKPVSNAENVAQERTCMTLKLLNERKE